MISCPLETQYKVKISFCHEVSVVKPIIWSWISTRTTNGRIYRESSKKKRLCFFATQTVTTFFLFIFIAFLFIYSDSFIIWDALQKQNCSFFKMDPRYWNIREILFRRIDISKNDRRRQLIFTAWLIHY